jgi:beta-lactamase regulating signal transducer with metallopeptidase domain
MKFAVESGILAGWGGFLGPAIGKGFIILALVFAAMALWRRGAASTRHLTWAVTFLCLLCLPVFVKCLPAWRVPAWIVPSGLNNSLPNSLSFDLQSKTQSHFESARAVSEARNADGNLPDASQQTPQLRYVVNWKNIATSIWFAGTMIGLTRLLAIQFRLERMTGKAQPCKNSEWLGWIDDLRMEYRIKRPVKLLITETPASPMTWGFWKATIMLPAESLQWGSERLQVVLRHELAHVKRRDCLTQEIAHLVCAIYWFNPLVGLAVRRMRAEREKACDDFVLNAGARPSAYAGHLVEIARQFASANAQGAVTMARSSGLEQRITAILDGRRNRNRIAKTTSLSIVLAIFSLELLIGGCAPLNTPQKWSLKQSEIGPQIKAFVAEKEAQESRLIQTDGKNFAENHPNDFTHLLVPDCRPLFSAAAEGDWQTASNLLSKLQKNTLGLGLKKATNGFPRGMWLIPVQETCYAVEDFAGGEKFSVAFGDDIIKSIPAGSIYFGGTDSGRFIVTAMQKSQVNADPFFTLTQNALADRTYLDYLRSMYGDRIYIPNAADLQGCFNNFYADIRSRLERNQLKPGENAIIDTNTGRMDVSGPLAITEVDGLIAKVIFDKSTNQEFYLEESFPFDWMYPYLEPHGLIFKIVRQPLTALPDEIVRQDHDYWTKTVSPMIGNWLNDGTSVQDVAAFAEKVFLRHDFSDFTGDPDFVESAYAHRMFSKERDSIGGLYAWRARNVADAEEKQRMNEQADFAFRQAWALCPYGPDVVFRYVRLLMDEKRYSDALLVAETASEFRSGSGIDKAGIAQIDNLVAHLKNFQQGTK